MIENQFKKVNINDIEDLIEAKIEIDKNDQQLNGKRSDLNKFIAQYCNLSDIILFNNETYPFKLVDQYIFVSDNSHYSKIIETLEKIHFNLDNLSTPISILDLINNNQINNKYILIHDNKQYLI